MRTGRVVAVVMLVAASCGGGGPDASDATSTSLSSTTAVAPSTLAPTTAPPVSSTTSTPTTPPVEPGLPSSWLRYGADGLVRVSGDDEELLVDGPIGWATSDGAGGALFTEWSPDRFGPIWWLAAGSDDPVVAWQSDYPPIAALVDEQPAAVGSIPTDDCTSDGDVDMVATILAHGERVTLQCGVGGQDAGREPDSFGGGIYVGVEWNAVHPSGRSTDIRLVFRDESGEVVELPTNPYPGDCSPCMLSAALAPDGTRLAVIHRRDAPPFLPDEYDGWLATTSSIEAELQVFDLSTGDEVFAQVLPSGATPEMRGWFDGRFVALGPDAFVYPWLERGARGDAVRALQQRLVEDGADIEVDGIFGSGTEAAVEAFHTARFGRARSTVGPDTWVELGVPVTIIDTGTGSTRVLSGRLALELNLTDGPVPGVEPRRPAGFVDGVILRPDGLGPFTFGAAADDVQAWLVEQLGEPDEAVVEPGQGGWPLMSCTERRFAYWAGAGFTVGYTDLNSYDATGIVPDCDDAPQLASWYVDAVSSPWFAHDHGAATVSVELRLTTGEGVGLGATAGHLRAIDPGVAFGEWDIDEWDPAAFQTSSGMRGRVAWDPVADVQRALNERGAELTVDGTFGPRTRAALAEFQASSAIDEDVLGPRTLAALDVVVPDDAPIVYLSGGTWDWDF